MKEIILNGMNKGQIKEAREALMIIDEGFGALENQIERIEKGEDVTQKEIRAAKLKLNEGMYIMQDLQLQQGANAKLYNNPNQHLRQARRNKKRGR